MPSLPTVKKNPVEYAETDLKVHLVYESAEFAKNELDKVLTELSDKRDVLRGLEQQREWREMELSIDERAKHVDLSQAAFERHLKEAIPTDKQIINLRNKIATLKSEIDGLECDREIHKQTIAIETARMTELGGYLQYLAAAKLASLSKKGAPSASTVAEQPQIPGW